MKIEILDENGKFLGFVDGCSDPQREFNFYYSREFFGAVSWRPCVEPLPTPAQLLVAAKARKLADVRARANAANIAELSPTQMARLLTSLLAGNVPSIAVRNAASAVLSNHARCDSLEAQVNGLTEVASIENVTW